MVYIKYIIDRNIELLQLEKKTLKIIKFNYNLTTQP